MLNNIKYIPLQQILIKPFIRIQKQWNLVKIDLLIQDYIFDIKDK